MQPVPLYLYILDVKPSTSSIQGAMTDGPEAGGIIPRRPVYLAHCVHHPIRQRFNSTALSLSSYVCPGGPEKGPNWFTQPIEQPIENKLGQR